jgi:hypothetical protein
MHFGFLLLLSPLGISLASPIGLEARDVSVFHKSLDRIVATLSRLDVALKSVPSGGSSDQARIIATDLIRLDRNYVEELRLGSRDIRRSAFVPMTESVKLTESLEKFRARLGSTMTGWVNAKNMVTAAGKKAEVLDTLLTTSEATASFHEASITKLSGPLHQAVTRSKTFQAGIIETAIMAYKR